jgi:hypothetical protein|tara:strand:- start:2183 stop:2566 length:384 start_codon:yes stop_codon:yes gene_type:complete
MKEIDNFIKKVVKNESDTLAIDFDGVIHDHNLGFHDGTVYGDPIPGAIEAVKKLSKKYKIVIFTCKANPKRPLIDGKTGPELIWEWLEKHDLKSCVEDVTYDKINALYYIDDKAISFNNWDNTLKHL